MSLKYMGMKKSVLNLLSKCCINIRKLLIHCSIKEALYNFQQIVLTRLASKHKVLNLVLDLRRHDFK